MAQTVVGVYDTHAHAIRAVEELRREGFEPQQISIFAPDPREAPNFAEEVGVRVVQGSATGAAAGGLIGGLSGWLVGLTGLLVPGAGFVLAAGPIAGAFVGLIGGASVGGFIGMLVGLGLPRAAAEQYNHELVAGRTLVMVHADGEFGLAERAMFRAHPLGLHHYDERIGDPSVLKPAAEIASPTGRAEPAAVDRSFNPGDVATAIEGQSQMGHTQYLDEENLRPVGGRSDT